MLLLEICFSEPLVGYSASVPLEGAHQPIFDDVILVRREDLPSYCVPSSLSS